ncbi:hypothetical protein BTVI_59159 [Pitangus sulphuratus]|nr:hypothetical protein BTVI_59159 [Pitangus sulphuratus]
MLVIGSIRELLCNDSFSNEIACSRSGADQEKDRSRHLLCTVLDPSAVLCHQPKCCPVLALDEAGTGIGVKVLLYDQNLGLEQNCSFSIQSLVWTLEITLDGSGILSVDPGLGYIISGHEQDWNMQGWVSLSEDTELVDGSANTQNESDGRVIFFRRAQKQAL